MASTKEASERMSQSEVLNHFAERFDLKRTRVKEMFDELSVLATSEVRQNGKFVLPGFGKLVKAERKAREGRNPASGEAITIPARTSVKFRLSKAMKDAVVPAKK